MRTKDSRRARYDALLKTVEWQVFTYERKRAAGFKCEACPTQGERNLQTHHWWYDVSRMPWEVEPGQVCVLCSVCHDGLTRQWEAFKAVIEGRWASGELRAGAFLQLVRRYMWGGFTPQSFGEFTARLGLGVGGPLGPVAMHAVAGLATIEALCKAKADLIEHGTPYE